MLSGQALGRAIAEAIKLKKNSGKIKFQADIARHFGVSRASIHDWQDSGFISKDKLAEVWRYFSDVVGPEHWGLDSWPTDVINPDDNKIPVRTWEQSNAANEETKEWLDVPHKLRKENMFALKVDNSAWFPTFQIGDMLIVEVGVNHQSGNIVIVASSDSAPMTCKRLIQEANQWYLDPIVSRYPTKPLGDIKVLGVVRQLIRKF
jgi:SOS-response transcriptional repressor LexA